MGRDKIWIERGEEGSSGRRTCRYSYDSDESPRFDLTMERTSSGWNSSRVVGNGTSKQQHQVTVDFDIWFVLVETKDGDHLVVKALVTE